MKLRSSREIGVPGENTAPKRKITHTKADARTKFSVYGDRSLIKVGGKGVTSRKINFELPPPRGAPGGRRPGPKIMMIQLEVDWGIGNDQDFYYGMMTERAQSILAVLNPTLSMAISIKRHQYSVVSSGSFLRIISDIEGKVVGFARR